MAQRNVSTTFELRATVPGIPGAELIMEQEPFPDMSSRNFLDYVSEQGIQLTAENSGAVYQRFISQCDDDDESFTARIIIRTIPRDLPYTFEVTSGEVGPRLREEIDSTKRVTFELENSAQLNKIVTDITGAEWEGPILNQLGERVEAPEITIDNISGFNVLLNQEIYGNVNIRMREEYDVYEVKVPRRSDLDADPDNAAGVYDSKAVAVWNGNVTELTIEVPELIGNCQGGINVQVPDDDPDDEDFDCFDLEITYNRCTGEEISRREIPVPCSQVSDGA